ncbi:MAG: 16S rRNA (guanine(527)-N(7))-methyltransferase RsmG [Shimia sp.]
MNVSRETEADLALFEEAIRQWSPRINLVSRADLARLRERHVADSLQLVPWIDGRTICDLGSGGGLPAIPLAIHAKHHSPSTRLTLIEADIRKAVFLRQVIDRLSLPATVLSRRIEDAPAQGAAIVTARALAPLHRLLALAERHAAPGARFVFPKGKSAQDEIVEAKREWRFTCTAHRSKTDPAASILEIGDLARV